MKILACHGVSHIAHGVTNFSFRGPLHGLWWSPSSRALDSAKDTPSVTSFRTLRAENEPFEDFLSVMECHTLLMESKMTRREGVL